MTNGPEMSYLQPQFRILHYIQSNPECTSGQIALALYGNEKRRSDVHRCTKHLVAKGFVTFERKATRPRVWEHVWMVKEGVDIPQTLEAYAATQPSLLEVMILRYMTRPMTVKQFAVLMKQTISSNLYNAFKRLHARKEIHIHNWDAKRCIAKPIFILGPGEDAKKPRRHARRGQVLTKMKLDRLETIQKILDIRPTTLRELEAIMKLGYSTIFALIRLMRQLGRPIHVKGRLKVARTWEYVYFGGLKPDEPLRELNPETRGMRLEVVNALELSFDPSERLNRNTKKFREIQPFHDPLIHIFHTPVTA